MRRSRTKKRKWLLWAVGLYAVYYLVFLAFVYLSPAASTRWEEKDWVYTPLSHVAYLEHLAEALERDLLGDKCEDKFLLIYTSSFTFNPIGVRDLYFEKKLHDFRLVRFWYSDIIASKERVLQIGEAMRKVNRIMADDCMT